MAGVRNEQVHFSRPVEARVYHHILLVIQAQAAKSFFAKLAHRVRLTGADHKIIRGIGLQHPPHGIHVIAGKAPIAARFQVAQAQLFGQAKLDAGRAVGDLAGDKFQAAARAFVVEQDA